MPTLPAVTGGGFSLITAAAQYPLTRTNNAATTIKRFINGTEQRFQTRSGRNSYTLTYTNISLADRESLRAFVASVGGSVQPWTFNGDIVSAYCQFQDQAFSWQENKQYPNRYNGSIRFRQTSTGAAPNVALTPTAFPVFSLGYSIGYPYTRTDNYQTAQNNLPQGNQVVYQFFGSGLAGFPLRPLYSWSFSLNNLNDTDVQALENHFISAGGRYASFPFPDPDDLQTYQVRYDIDALAIQHVGPRASTVKVQLAEAFGG